MTASTIQLAGFAQPTVVASQDIFYSASAVTGVEQKPTAQQLQTFIQAPIANSTLTAAASLTGTETVPIGKGGLFQTTLTAIAAWILAGAKLTGTPVAPTAVAGTNTTQVATTAYATAADAALQVAMQTYANNAVAAMQTTLETYVNTQIAAAGGIGTGGGTGGASASGTTLPPATQLIDSNLAVWTVVGGVIKINGANAGTSSDCIRLIYFNGVIYQEDYANLFWKWVSSAWVATTNPLTVTPSASGTVVPTSGSSLTDAYGNTWTLSSGVPAQNGYADPTGMTGISTILYYNSLIYVESAASVWSVWQGGAWTTTTDPRIVGPTIALPYYAINAHYIQGGIFSSIPLATQAALIQTFQPNGKMGCRQDCYNASDLATIANTVVPGMGAVPVIACFIPNMGTTVANTYSSCHALGITAAQLLAGKIPMLEIGNEWDIASLTIAGTINTTDGNLPSQYDQASMALYMAAMRGVIDGFRSIDTTGKTLLGVNNTYIHIGFLKMLVQGTLPDGTAATYGAIPFDIITWHDYQTGGDMDSTDGFNGVQNLFTEIAALTSKPIWFSEIGGGDPSVTNSQIVTYLGVALPEMIAHAQCAGCCYYELYDFEAAYGLYSMSGSTPTAKPQVATLKAFIAANPR
jgi:hypothetical protein